LERMIAAIAADLENNPVSERLTVTLGDYIDRGSDSRGVIERLITNPFPSDFIALKGNHEVILEKFLQDPSVADEWRRFGALETLSSYGVAVTAMMVGKGYEQAAAGLAAAMPQTHLQFIASLRTPSRWQSISSVMRECALGWRWNSRSRMISCGSA